MKSLGEMRTLLYIKDYQKRMKNKEKQCYINTKLSFIYFLNIFRPFFPMMFIPNSLYLSNRTYYELKPIQS